MASFSPPRTPVVQRGAGANAASAKKGRPAYSPASSSLARGGKVIDRPVTFHAKIKSSGYGQTPNTALGALEKKERIASSKLQRTGSSNVVARRQQLFLLRSCALILPTVPPCMCTKSIMTTPWGTQMPLSLHCIAYDSVKTERGLAHLHQTAP